MFQGQSHKITKLVILSSIAMSALACAPQSQQPQSQLASESSESIVNGTAVKSQDVLSKSTVALYINFPKKDGTTELMNFCTGTLISKDLVLSAGHCFADFAKQLGVSIEVLRPHLRVGFGIDVGSDLNDKRVEFRSIKNIVVHKDYVVDSVVDADTNPMEDIAMVKLDADAPASAKTASLPGTDKHLVKDKSVTLVGFGLTDGVKGTSATGMNKVNVKIDEPHFTTAQFTYKTLNGKSACSGDSGGPAYIKSQGKVFVVGVTSWGDRNCQVMGAYTSVYAFLPWIMETAQALSAQ